MRQCWRVMAMPLRSVPEALAWGTGQVSHPSRSWKGLCQSFVRSSMGAPAWAPTAYDAWLKVPQAHRNDGSLALVPAGAAVYFERNHRGAERPGHVALSLGGGRCLSNDIYRAGMIDEAGLSVFGPSWNMTYLGWSFWTPFGFMGKS